MYLEKRRRKWYALHDIPGDVRKAIGKARFVKSLETEVKHEAKRRAAILEAKWRGEIESARRGNADHVERDARYWRNALRNAVSEDERETIRDLIADEASDRELQAASRAGILSFDDPAYDQVPGVLEAQRFFAVATGTLIKTDEHLDEYLATLKNEAKSVDMKRATIKRFSEEFPYLTDITRKKVQKWVNGMVADNKAVGTVRRTLSELRGYWGYLVSVEAASENNMPFEKLAVPKPPKKSNGRDTRQHFDPADVVQLLNAAEARGDNQLADLIRLGMWTGGKRPV